MITQPEIEHLKSRIVEVIEQRIPLTKTAGGWKGKCPWHEDRSPSLTISERKRIWRCWVCNVGGDIFDFLEKYYDVDFKGTLKILGLNTVSDPYVDDIWRKASESFRAIERDKGALLETLNQKYGEMCWLNRANNQLLNIIPPLERDASLFRFERWLESEFERIELERRKVERIAQDHKRKVRQWIQEMLQQSGTAA